MDVHRPTLAHAGPALRRQNRRGEGERLREEIISAAMRLLDELADDEALSLRAVAREVGVAATSVYIYFADRDALVLAVMERCHGDLVRAVEQAEAAGSDPADSLRRRTRFHAEWARQHPGLYKVLHESRVNQRVDMPSKDDLTERTAAAIRRCMNAGLAPAGDAAQVALDLRTAVHGMVSLRINQPQFPWPPVEEQIDRYLTKLVGIRAART